MDNHFLYFPTRTLNSTPAAAGLEFEEIRFPAVDGTSLHGWLVPGQPDFPLVLFFHGNAGNIGDRVHNLQRLHQAGYPVFIFDYRGYGHSGGSPSETGTSDDGRGAVAWLEQRGYPPAKTLYFGRSLGAAIALQMALEFSPAGLVMESPFTSIRAMGRWHYPVLSRLFGWLLSAEYNNEENIGSLTVPLLLIHGTADSIVPPIMGKRLFELAPEPKRIYLVKGADHNDSFYLGDVEYWQNWHWLTSAH